MVEKVLAYMKEFQMLPENGHIVAGVSGGADSVCLLWILVNLRTRCKLRVTAVHVNHGLRPEAGQDMDFVGEMCARWEVPFVAVEEDVASLANMEGISCEEAGRKVRYRAFEQTLAQMDAGQSAKGCIAVAHNRDDRAETLLFHLFRGTGLTGMGSIRPVRPSPAGRVVRPLLFCGREEIEAFLNREGIEWREDSSNKEDMYTRNRIRNRVLPYVHEAICPNVSQHLAREAQLLTEAADFIENRTKEAMRRCCPKQSENSLLFHVACFCREEPFLQGQILMMGLRRLGVGRDLTGAHIEEIKKLFYPSRQSGKKVELPFCGVYARRLFDMVKVVRIQDGACTQESQKEALEKGILMIQGRNDIPFLGEVYVRLLHKEAGDRAFEDGIFFGDIPEKKYTKWLDYDKITKSAVFRTRRAGDYLTIDAAFSKKSLKRYFIDEKIPADERERLPVLADGSHILWVPGYRISAAFKVTAQTKRILQIHLAGGEQDGRKS